MYIFHAKLHGALRKVVKQKKQKKKQTHATYTFSSAAGDEWRETLAMFDADTWQFKYALM